MSVSELPIKLVEKYFHPLTTGHFWQPDCEYVVRSSNCSRGYAMLGELLNVPTDTLFDMLYIVLAREVVISASDAAQIEQIQRELQRRASEQCWSFQTVN